MAQDDLWGRLMTDLAGLIAGLNLTTTTTATASIQSVIVWSLEDQLNIPTFPVVIVTNVGLVETEDEDHSNFEEDWVNYPVSILIVDTQRNDYQTAQKTYRAWRRTMQTTFRGLVNPNPGLTINCPEFNDCRLSNQEVVPKEIMEKQFSVSGFIALCRCNEARVRS